MSELVVMSNRWNLVGLLTFCALGSIAREHVATRFGPDAKDKRDLIVSA